MNSLTLNSAWARSAHTGASSGLPSFAALAVQELQTATAFVVRRRPAERGEVHRLDPLLRRGRRADHALRPRLPPAVDERIVEQDQRLRRHVRHVRRPTVENGIGVSKASSSGDRKLRRTAR